MDRVPLSVMDSRGTKFTIGAIYPPEIQKIMADKLKEAMVLGGQLKTGQLGSLQNRPTGPRT
jgi:hypothetical protein